MRAKSRFRVMSAVSALILAHVVAAPAAHAVATYLVPATVPSGTSCSAGLPDATTSLNAWLATTVTSNSTARLNPNRCYRTDGTVVLGAKTNVAFDGNDSTFKRYIDDTTNRTNAHFKIAGNNGVTVYGLHIVGAKPASTPYDATTEAQHGIWISGNTGVSLSYNTVDFVRGDYVNISKSSTQVPTGIDINSNSFGGAATGSAFGAGRQEISITDGVNINVIANYFGHGARSGIDIEPNSSGAQISSVMFYRNDFGPNHLMWFANHGANATITGVWFYYNTASRDFSVNSVVPTTAGINVNDPSTFRRSDYQFLGNSSTVENGTGNCSTTPPGAGMMRIIGVNGVQIDGNVATLDANRCQYLLNGQALRNATVTNNILTVGNTLPASPDRVGNYPGPIASIVCESGNLIDGNPAPLSVAASIC